MALTLQSVTQFISALRDGIVTLLSSNPPQGQVTDFNDGSVAGALTETISDQLAFVQNVGPQVLAVTRLATCTLPDAITFVADYWLSPDWNPPTVDFGYATFTRNQVSASPQYLYAGTIIQTPTSSPSSAIQYVVIGNTFDATWSAIDNAYILAPGHTTLTPAINAVKAGTASNVLQGTLTVIASPNVPFDTVTNGSDINNAVDGETLQQLQQRFADYIGGLSSGTRFRIAAIVEGVQDGLTFTINEYTNIDQTPRDGFTTIVVDDGSGAISGGLLTTIETAIIDPAKGKSLGSQVKPIAPSNVAITVVVSGTTIKTGFSQSTVRSAIQAAIVAYVNANGVGGAPDGTGSNPPSLKLPYVGIVNLVASFIGSNSGQGLASYSGVTVNAGTADIPLTAFQLARTSSGSVTVS